LGARANALGRQDVAALAIGVAQQCQVGAAVRVVFQALYLGWDTVLVALEVHHAVVLLVTTTHVTRGDVAIVVTARSAVLLLDQRSMGLALVQVWIDHAHHGAAPRRCRFKFNQCHDVYPCSLAAKLIS
jgi:hypothetical protein